MTGGGSLLTLDRGNSTLDCMVSGEAQVRVRLPVGDRDAMRELGQLARQASVAIGCTVVVDGLRDAALVLQRVGVPLRVAAVDLPCPLVVNYALPASLGADRWVAALAARQAYGDAVVVDCGSALTVDAVTAGGVFLGGAIAPGLAAMAAGLRGAAPALPHADPIAAVDGVPVSSADAVSTGVELGYCGAVERLIREMVARADLQAATTVLTGGDAETYMRRATLPFEWVGDLVHRGLRHLWQSAVESA